VKQITAALFQTSNHGHGQNKENNVDKFMHYVCDRLEAMMRNSVEHGPVINKLTNKREKFVSVDVIDEFLQEIIHNLGVNQRIERKKSGEIFLEDLQNQIKNGPKRGK
jgi:hypothetical protein